MSGTRCRGYACIPAGSLWWCAHLECDVGTAPARDPKCEAHEGSWQKKKLPRGHARAVLRGPWVSAGRAELTCLVLPVCTQCGVRVTGHFAVICFEKSIQFVRHVDGALRSVSILPGRPSEVESDERGTVFCRTSITSRCMRSPAGLP
jgi:hypothetical protein